MTDEQKALIPETHEEDLPASTGLATVEPRGGAQSSPSWFGGEGVAVFFGPENAARKDG